MCNTMTSHHCPQLYSTEDNISVRTYITIRTVAHYLPPEIQCSFKRTIPYLPQHSHTLTPLPTSVRLSPMWVHNISARGSVLFPWWSKFPEWGPGVHGFRSNGSPASAFRTVRHTCGSDQKAVKVNVDVTTLFGSGLCRAHKWSREGWTLWTQVHTKELHLVMVWPSQADARKQPDT